MAKITIGGTGALVATKKKTSIGNNNAMTKMSSMNKNKKRGYKKYRGQGKV